MSNQTILTKTAQIIAVQLEQVAHRTGRDLIPPVSNEMLRCETSVRNDVIGALTELVSLGLAEWTLSGSRDKKLVCFAQPLDREYRLTPRGHSWKIHALREVTAHSARLLGE